MVTEYSDRIHRLSERWILPWPAGYVPANEAVIAVAISAISPIFRLRLSGEVIKRAGGDVAEWSKALPC